MFFLTSLFSYLVFGLLFFCLCRCAVLCLHFWSLPQSRLPCADFIMPFVCFFCLHFFYYICFAFWFCLGGFDFLLGYEIGTVIGVWILTMKWASSWHKPGLVVANLKEHEPNQRKHKEPLKNHRKNAKTQKKAKNEKQDILGTGS